MAQDWTPLNKKALCSLESMLEMLLEVSNAAGVSVLSELFLSHMTKTLASSLKVGTFSYLQWFAFELIFLVLLKPRLNIPGQSQQLVSCVLPSKIFQ